MMRTLRFRSMGSALLLVLMSAGLMGTAAGADVTVMDRETARVVAANWLRLGQDEGWGWDAQSTIPAAGELQAVAQTDGTVLGYVAPLESGYIVVPAYAELPPVTAYSTDAALNLADEGGFALCCGKRWRLSLK